MKNIHLSDDFIFPRLAMLETIPYECLSIN